MIRQQVKVGSRNIKKKERNEKPKCIKKRIKYSYSVGKYECELRNVTNMYKNKGKVFEMNFSGSPSQQIRGQVASSRLAH